MPYIKNVKQIILKSKYMPCIIIRDIGESWQEINSLSMDKKQKEPKKQRGARRNFKIHNKHHVFMEQSIGKNPKITLQQMKQLLKN